MGYAERGRLLHAFAAAVPAEAALSPPRGTCRYRVNPSRLTVHTHTTRTGSARRRRDRVELPPGFRG